MRSLSLRPGDLLTIPRDGFVDGLQVIGLPPPRHPSHGALALTPTGLPPVERAGLCRTHYWSSDLSSHLVAGGSRVVFLRILRSATAQGCGPRRPRNLKSADNWY